MRLAAPMVAAIASALIVGGVAGAAMTRATTFVNRGWVTGGEFASRPSAFQQGYVAGMADAVLHIAYNGQHHIDYGQRELCLDRNSGLSKSTSGYLTTLVTWAQRTMRAHPSETGYTAASTLIKHACK
jgi:hypothetical protein